MPLANDSIFGPDNWTNSLIQSMAVNCISMFVDWAWLIKILIISDISAPSGSFLMPLRNSHSNVSHLKWQMYTVQRFWWKCSIGLGLTLYEFQRCCRPASGTGRPEFRASKRACWFLAPHSARISKKLWTDVRTSFWHRCDPGAEEWMRPGRTFAMTPLRCLLAIGPVIRCHSYNSHRNLCNNRKYESINTESRFDKYFDKVPTSHKATQCGEDAWKQRNYWASCHFHDVE